jgi:hypothetical protein
VDRSEWPWCYAPADCTNRHAAEWHAIRSGGDGLPRQGLEQWVAEREGRAGREPDQLDAIVNARMAALGLNGNGAGAAAVVTALASVRPRRVKWLWRGRLALGKLSTLEGHPDVGKSTITLDIAARVTRGDEMPDGSPGLGKPAGVLLLATAEDGLADTIVPRLMAAGADMARVHSLDGIRDTPGGEVRPFALPRDLPYLAAEVARHGVRLVVVDAVMAILPADVNSYRDQDVRLALHPLATLAEQTGAAVCLNRHFVKAGGVAAISKGGGSVAFTAIVRSAMQAFRDPDPAKEGLKLLAVAKCNNVADDQKQTLAYRLVPEVVPTDDGDTEVPRVQWEGLDPRSADDVLRQAERTTAGDTERERAEAWLVERLGTGWAWSDELLRDWKAAGGSQRTLERARRDAEVQTKRVGFGQSGRVAVALPGVERWPASTTDRADSHRPPPAVEPDAGGAGWRPMDEPHGEAGSRGGDTPDIGHGPPQRNVAGHGAAGADQRGERLATDTDLDDLFGPPASGTKGVPASTTESAPGHRGPSATGGIDGPGVGPVCETPVAGSDLGGPDGPESPIGGQTPTLAPYGASGAADDLENWRELLPDPVRPGAADSHVDGGAA